MMERYPFFREETERTLAVIGVDAVTADLNGTYQKPYAILTQLRLYCKGERLSGGKPERGNFIVNSSELLSASFPEKKRLSTWLLEVIFALNVIFLMDGIYKLYVGFAMKGLEYLTLSLSSDMLFIAPVLLALGLSVVLYQRGYHKGIAVILLLPSICGVVSVLGIIFTSGISFFSSIWQNSILQIFILMLGMVHLLLAKGNDTKQSFFIVHKNGEIFSFDKNAYAVEEFQLFSKQFELVQAGQLSIEV